MPKQKYFITKEYLEEHYIKQQKSTITISEELGVKSTNTIKRLLKKYEIPIRTTSRIGRPHKNVKKFGEIHKSYLYILKSRAERLGYDFDIDGDYIWKLYLKQKRKCALSGLGIVFPIAWGTKSKSDITASLDRIDSSKGYTKDNVQWLHKIVNTMKMHMTDKEFITICTNVAKHNL
jgi:hypothetical protein